MAWKSGKEQWCEAYWQVQAETGLKDGDPRLDRLATERARQAPSEDDMANMARDRGEGAAVMNYDYQTERASLFTEDNQKLFLGIRDRVKYFLRETGAFTMEKGMRLPIGVGAASSWEMMACVDRLVELGEIREVTVKGKVAGQSRVFVSAEEE